MNTEKHFEYLKMLWNSITKNYLKMSLNAYKYAVKVTFWMLLGTFYDLCV